MSKILQCHSKGDKRFSPLFCYISAFKVTDTIENHYQMSKIFEIDGIEQCPNDFMQAKDWQLLIKKGNSNIKRNNEEFVLPNGDRFPIKYQVYGWYSSLWLKYLDLHPELVAYASEFDDYVDIFKHNFPLCQADCIRLYCKQGRQALLDTCKDFLDLVRVKYAKPTRPHSSDYSINYRIWKAE